MTGIDPGALTAAFARELARYTKAVAALSAHLCGPAFTDPAAGLAWNLRRAALEEAYAKAAQELAAAVYEAATQAATADDDTDAPLPDDGLRYRFVVGGVVDTRPIRGSAELIRRIELAQRQQMGWSFQRLDDASATRHDAEGG